MTRMIDFKIEPALKKITLSSGFVFRYYHYQVAVFLKHILATLKGHISLHYMQALLVGKRSLVEGCSSRTRLPIFLRSQ